MSAMDVAELATITAAEVIDARGAACPGPLLEAKKGMGKRRLPERRCIQRR